MSRALVVVFLAGVAGCKPGAKAPPAPPPAEVGVVSVAPRTLPLTYEFVGEVQPTRRVEVRARTDGIIEARPFTEGAFVKPGDVLYRLERVRSDAAYRSAVARLSNARRTLARLEPLLIRNAVAQQDVDNARTEAESAQADLDEASKNRSDAVVRAERLAARILRLARRRRGLGADAPRRFDHGRARRPSVAAAGPAAEAAHRRLQRPWLAGRAAGHHAGGPRPHRRARES